MALVISWNAHTQETMTSLSGKVLDEEGKPVAGLELGIKPVKFSSYGEMTLRKPFLMWSRTETDSEGRFSFKNIDTETSQITMFPEHGSEYEFISMTIDDLSFHSIAFRRGMPTAFGKLTFKVQEGEHLENVIVNVKTPRTRIRGRILLQDGTPLVNAEVPLTVSRYHHSPGGSSSRRGSTGYTVTTDNEGYFVSYNAEAPAGNRVKMTYKGMVENSDNIILNEGERYDDLVFVLNNFDRDKKYQDVWIVNPNNGHGYKKIECDSWKDAKAKATALNAHLVAINDEVEQEWLEGLFHEKSFFWIGLRVPENKASWQWDNGQPITYTNWRISPKPDYISVNERNDPFVLGFFTKKWMVIGSNSLFLSSVKHAILEKEGLNVPKPTLEK